MVATKKILIKATQAEVQGGTMGACNACGEMVYDGVEPDARNYECDSCGAMEVFGLQELLFMDRINLIDEEE